MQESSQASLSGEQWNLHRNALISSGLLFLYCSKSISDLSIWNIPFSESFLSTVPILLLIIATYCFFAFFFEWISGPAQQAMKSIEQIGDLREQLLKSIAKCELEINHVGSMYAERVRSSLDFDIALKDSIDELDKTNPIPVKLYQEDYSTRTSIQNLVLELYHMPLATKPQNLSQFLDQLPAREAEFNERLAEITKFEYLQSLRISLEKVSDQFQSTKDGIVAADEKVIEKINSAIRSIKEIPNSLYPVTVALTKSKLVVSVRTFIIGIIVPAIVYMIAVAHFLGLYFSAFPSLTDTLHSIVP